MSVAPLSKLPADRRRELLDDLNYLNIAEIKLFCKQHAIPYTIAIETADGRRRKSSDDDRKGIVLERIRHFLKTGSILQETCFRAAVVCFDPLHQKLTPDDQKLTGGRFGNGAIARIVSRDFWSRGEAPTLREFAAGWMKARGEHTRPNPEWAFLSDRASHRMVADWKALRAKRASAALRMLDEITAR